MVIVQLFDFDFPSNPVSLGIVIQSNWEITSFIKLSKGSWLSISFLEGDDSDSDSDSDSDFTEEQKTEKRALRRISNEAVKKAFLVLALLKKYLLSNEDDKDMFVDNHADFMETHKIQGDFMQALENEKVQDGPSDGSDNSFA
jgi:hypothetical protein